MVLLLVLTKAARTNLSTEVNIAAARGITSEGGGDKRISANICCSDKGGQLIDRSKHG